MIDDIKRKKTEKLETLGFQYLKEKKYEEALEISQQLEDLNYTGAFDLAAQVYSALGDTEKAINTLERGLAIEPNCWPNIQLLGNYLSDIGKYDEAEAKYKMALQCDGVWGFSIKLNQAKS